MSVTKRLLSTAGVERKKAVAKAKAESKATETETETVIEVAADATEITTPIVLSERDTTWQGYCKYGDGLRRRPAELTQFKIDLQAGCRPDVIEPVMMTAAVNLVTGMSAAGVRRWDWLPAPNADDLADPAAWAARRLAERRAEQDAIERIRRGQQKLAQALGQSPARGNGTGRPVYVQRLRRPLAEMAARLELVMSKHQTVHGEFNPKWLDPNSPRFITGITNKQIIMMASEITGMGTWRSFEENWKIVTDWLSQRRKEEPTQPEPNQA